MGADRIDYFGLEQGLVDRVTPFVTLDQFAMLKRTLAYQRPVTTLDHKVGLGELSLEEVDRRLQQNLFYGIFPGAWNFVIEADGGAGFPTWTQDRYRALWAPYVPIFRDLAAAGWEPVTWAWSSNGNVWVERFGWPGDGDLHLTLHNETAVPQSLALTVDLAELGPIPSAGAVERVTGRHLTLARDASGALGTIMLTVPATSTRVVSFAGRPSSSRGDR
jgi:hypothetical protein